MSGRSWLSLEFVHDQILKRFIADKVAVWQLALWVLLFFRDSTIPPMLNSHLILKLPLWGQAGVGCNLSNKTMLFQITKAVDRKVFPNLGRPRLGIIALFIIAYTIPGRELYEDSTPRLTNWLVICCRVTWTRSFTRKLRIVTVLCTQLGQYCVFNHYLVEILSPIGVDGYFAGEIAENIAVFIFAAKDSYLT